MDLMIGILLLFHKCKVSLGELWLNVTNTSEMNQIIGNTAILTMVIAAAAAAKGVICVFSLIF